MTASVADDLGRIVELPTRPARVISLVPSITELVCALGCADRLIAVTRYCTHPPDVVARLQKVGGTKNPDWEEIVGLRPDVVILNAEENRREDFDRLVASGIAVFVIFPRTVAGAARSIENLGSLLDASTVARQCAHDIGRAYATVSATIHARVNVFCPIWRKPWMSFNGDTFVHDVLWCAGGDNVCAAAPQRYPAVDLREVARAQPQVILLPDEPYHFRERHLSELEPLHATPAWRDRRVHFIDGRALSWYGPRTAAALHYFLNLLR